MRERKREREKGCKIEFIKLGSFLQSQKELTGKNYQKCYDQHSVYHVGFVQYCDAAFSFEFNKTQKKHGNYTISVPFYF